MTLLKKRILVIGQGDESTGFARVLTSVIPFLTHVFSIHHFAINYEGEVKRVSGDYTMYPNTLPGDVHGREQLGALLAQVKPDLVWILQDAWYFQILAEELMAYPDPLKIVVYSAIDNEALDKHNLMHLGFINEYVVFTHFAKGLCEAITQKEAILFPPIKVIPHGVNADTFYPLAATRAEARAQARNELFKDRPELKDTFIVLNANRNQYRKRIHTTIEGFALFARNKPDARLYLHTGMKMIEYNIPVLVKQAGIEDKVIYTNDSVFHPVVSNEHLNMIYNAADAGINTTGAEGWGLVSFEHAATGVAQVVPDHTACAEIWKDAAMLLKPLPIPEDEPRSSYDIAPEEVARVLELLYTDKELLNTTAQDCYRRATHPSYSWQHIAGQFEKIFTSLLSAKKA